MFGYARRQQQLNIALDGAGIGIQAAAAHIGIDRYLNGFAGSTFPADEVNDGAASFAADELGGFRGDGDFGGHRGLFHSAEHQAKGRPSQGALGSR